MLVRNNRPIPIELLAVDPSFESAALAGPSRFATRFSIAPGAIEDVPAAYTATAGFADLIAKGWIERMDDPGDSFTTYRNESGAPITLKAYEAIPGTPRVQAARSFVLPAGAEWPIEDAYSTTALAQSLIDGGQLVEVV